MFIAMAKSEIEHATHYYLSSVIQHDVTKYQNTLPITQIFVQSLLQAFPDFTGINFNISSGISTLTGSSVVNFSKAHFPVDLSFVVMNFVVWKDIIGKMFHHYARLCNHFYL